MSWQHTRSMSPEQLALAIAIGPLVIFVNGSFSIIFRKRR
jgi:hypothetical protein